MVRPREIFQDLFVFGVEDGSEGQHKWRTSRGEDIPATSKSSIPV